jgi:hypothetical protein
MFPHARRWVFGALLVAVPHLLASHPVSDAAGAAPIGVDTIAPRSQLRATAQVPAYSGPARAGVVYVRGQRLSPLRENAVYTVLEVQLVKTLLGTEKWIHLEGAEGDSAGWVDSGYVGRDSCCFAAK